ncbi:hypothetical protein INR49_003854 [Caranx melampygus]|nr:hypothetical protein INR49_003854 [Caranx melampygus]
MMKTPSMSWATANQNEHLQRPTPPYLFSMMGSTCTDVDMVAVEIPSTQNPDVLTSLKQQQVQAAAGRRLTETHETIRSDTGQSAITGIHTSPITTNISPMDMQAEATEWDASVTPNDWSRKRSPPAADIRDPITITMMGLWR